MKRYAYIFPNGTYFPCVSEGTENHIETVKTFLKGLDIVDEALYNKLIQIFRKHYNGMNYDDFAIFTLGWIKVTSHYTPTLCLAGYKFQYPILSFYSTPTYIIDIVDNFYKYPYFNLEDLNYEKIIEVGRKN